MDKKYLMKSMAALMLVASVSSCVSEVDEVNQTELNAAIKENAELQLGITIPEGQTWEMSTQVTTDIAINLGLDQSYTVGIYDVDPRFSKNSTFYTLEKVNEGGSLNTSITLPNAMRTAYVAVYDSNFNLQTVKVVSIVDDAIIANVGGVNRRAMRAAPEEWSHDHSDTWMEDLEFPQTAENLPTGAIDLTNLGNYEDQNGDKTNAVYYIPKNFSGTLNLEYKVKLKAGMKVYNFGTLNGIDKVNYEGVVTFYNAGTWNWNITSGQRHTVYNTGTLNVNSYANIGKVYNRSTLVLGNGADVPNDMSIYSTNEGTVEMPNGGDFKAAADIHGTLTVGGENNTRNIKIQNSQTQYICGLIVYGTLDMTQGKLETSYIHATNITFDGAHIWLLPEAHVVATNQISISNSGCEIYGYEDSYALIETQNFYLRNHNNFIDTFSANIQFKITGWIDIQERVTQSNGQVDDTSNKYNSAAEYLASQNGVALKNRMNLDNVYGVSECSDAYGTPDNTPGVKGGPNVYTYAFEDQKVSGDYDMNDIVLKVSHPYTVNSDGGYDYDTNKLKCELVAAGATFNIKVFIGNNTEALFERKEVHQALGVDEGVMVNTGTHTGVRNGVDPAECTVNAPIGWDGDFSNLDVKIYVMLTINEPYYIEYKKENEWPYAVMIPMDWQWPTERTRVTQAYSGFAAWASTPKTQRTAAMNEWYKTPVSGKVMSNQ